MAILAFIPKDKTLRQKTGVTKMDIMCCLMSFTAEKGTVGCSDEQYKYSTGVVPSSNTSACVVTIGVVSATASSTVLYCDHQLYSVMTTNSLVSCCVYQQNSVVVTNVVLQCSVTTASSTVL